MSDATRFIRAAIVVAGTFILVGCDGPSADGTGTSGGASGMANVEPVPGGPVDLDTPEGQVRAFRRMQCSEIDEKPVTYGWRGKAFSRVEGEADRVLFKVEGMNIRHCVTVTDPEKGEGFRLITREILLYLDPETGEVLRTWNNPFTGKVNQVLHVANDPVNNKPVFNGFSMPYQISGDHWWVTSTVPLFYSNPLGGDYQPYIGGTYHATEMFNFIGDVESLTSDQTDTAEIAVGWARMSNWLPWMEMGSRQGLIYMHTAGRKLNSYDDLPAVLKDEILKNYPEYQQPPPIDDDRRNETSWTYFKKMVESGEFKGSQTEVASGH